LPTQITNAWTKWITNNVNHGPSEMVKGSFQFVLYIVALVFITGFVVFTELSKRKIPVQHAGKGGSSVSMARASFLPIKINSAGVIPVIFAASIMSAPSIIASFISADAAKATWLKIFNYNETFTMPWFNGSHVEDGLGLVIYLALIIAFTFFYAEMEIDPETLADNFQKNGSYIPGIRPGKETERYVGKVLNRVTFIGAMALGFIGLADHPGHGLDAFRWRQYARYRRHGPHHHRRRRPRAQRPDRRLTRRKELRPSQGGYLTYAKHHLNGSPGCGQRHARAMDRKTTNSAHISTGDMFREAMSSGSNSATEDQSDHRSRRSRER
jgi:hypothetical protein